MPAPEAEYLSQAKLAEWLDLDPDDLRELIRSGVLPKAKQRRGMNRPVWSRIEAAVCKWIVDNPERFEVLEADNKPPKK